MGRTVTCRRPSSVAQELAATGGIHRSLEIPIEARRRRYLSVRWKFVLALTFALIWLGFSLWISLPWIAGLAGVISLERAVIVVTLLAFLPGLIIAFLVAGLTLDQQPALTVSSPTQPVTTDLVVTVDADACCTDRRSGCWRPASSPHRAKWRRWPATFWCVAAGAPSGHGSRCGTSSSALPR